MSASEPPDIMDDATFEQMVAEAVALLGVEPVFQIFEPVCGASNPLELEREQRTALMLRVGRLYRQAWGGAGHA
jgi:hypothetical protein